MVYVFVILNAGYNIRCNKILHPIFQADLGAIMDGNEKHPQQNEPHHLLVDQHDQSDQHVQHDQNDQHDQHDKHDQGYQHVQHDQHDQGDQHDQDEQPQQQQQDQHQQQKRKFDLEEEPSAKRICTDNKS
jgi:hypothetical protein